MVAEVGFFIALHQIIVVARRNHRLLLQLLDLAVSAAQKRSTGAFLLAYPLPPPPAAIGGRGMVQSPLRRAKEKGSPFGLPCSFVLYRLNRCHHGKVNKIKGF